MMNVIPLFHSCIFKRGIQQVPVLQHAGFPPELHSRESKSAPVCQRQPGLPAAVGVSLLLVEKKKLILLIISKIAAVLVDTCTESLVLSFFFLPVWWCSWPETCRLTSTPTSPTFSPSSPRCWTPKTQSSLSGLSLPSHTCTSTCGGWWWKTWATSTSQC